MQQLDPSQVAGNLRAWIAAVDPETRDVIEKFDFDAQIGRLDRASLLILVLAKVTEVDSHPDAVSNTEMGYLYEELIRRFSPWSLNRPDFGGDSNEWRNMESPRDPRRFKASHIGPDDERFEWSGADDGPGVRDGRAHEAGEGADRVDDSGLDLAGCEAVIQRVRTLLCPTRHTAAISSTRSTSPAGTQHRSEQRTRPDGPQPADRPCTEKGRLATLLLP